MKFKTIIKFAMDNIAQRFIMYMATLLLCYLAFGLLLFSLYSYQFTRQGRTVCEAILNGGIESTGMFQIMDYFYLEEEKLLHFMRQAYALNEINAMGSCSIGGNDDICFSELLKRQNEMIGTQNDYVMFLFMNQEALSICDLKIQKGKSIEELVVKEREYPLYLGSNFSDIPIGTVYEIKREDGTIAAKFEVVGILKKGMQWIDEEIYKEEPLLQLDYTTSMDNMGIMVIDYLITSLLTYTVADGYSIQDAEKKIETLAKQHEINIKFATFSSIIESKERKNALAIRTSSKMVIFICITIIVTLMCSQIAMLLDDTKRYGVFYANGASTMDFIYILFMENILKIIIAFLCAVFSGIFVLNGIFRTYGNLMMSLDVGQAVYWKQTVGSAFFIGIFLAGISSLIPIWLLKTFTPVHFMKHYET